MPNDPIQPPPVKSDFEAFLDRVMAVMHKLDDPEVKSTVMMIGKAALVAAKIVLKFAKMSGKQRDVANEITGIGDDLLNK